MRHSEISQVVWDAIRAYPWIHIGIGIFGNTSFFVGSIWFGYLPLRYVGNQLFMIGAAGMRLGNVGRALTDLERRRHRRS